MRKANIIRATMALTIGALLLGGCAAHSSTVFRKISLPQDKSNPRLVGVSIDAKQRTIVAVPVTTTITRSLTDGKRIDSLTFRYCAEPPPDALSAYSTAVTGELGLAGLSKDPEVRAKAALAMAETAGAIDRTQTVNLLRESLYRTCERYANGAIDEDEFIIQSARDQKAMVAILAIEQLTQAARPAPIVLGASGASAGLGGAADFAELRKASDAKVAADKDVQAAEARVAEAGRTDPPTPCGERLAVEKTTLTTDAEKAAYKACEEATAQLAAAKDKAERDKGWLATMERVTAVSSGPAAAVTAQAYAASVLQPRSDAHLAAVATVVKDIAASVPYDEIVMLCVLTVRRNGAPLDKCDDYFSKKVDAAIALTKAEQDQYEGEREALRSQRQIVTDYLTKAADGPKAWADLLDSLARPLAEVSPAVLKPMRAITTVEDAVSEFMNLDENARRQGITYIEGKGQ